jgi:hypothetical protein
MAAVEWQEVRHNYESSSLRRSEGEEEAAVQNVSIFGSLGMVVEIGTWFNITLMMDRLRNTNSRVRPETPIF